MNTDRGERCHGHQCLQIHAGAKLGQDDARISGQLMFEFFVLKYLLLSEKMKIFNDLNDNDNDNLE